MDGVKWLNPRWVIFAAAMLVALTWAATTHHVWEDYYITFRTSKNLATGHGLVFNQGERLHTFTSPLGVLLPAAASYLTGTSSDTAAIWLFRLWSAAAFGGAAVLLFALARRCRYHAFAAAALAAFVILDAKSVDFTTNGMETGFLLLFIAYALWAMFACTGRRWLHLGIAWGGLMWTRPDCFLYIALLGVGAFLFNDPSRTGRTRVQWLKLFLQAGAVCTVIYLPWIEWATWYYGTPVPHTIAAKGGVATGSKTVLGVFKTLVDFPITIWGGGTSLEGTFLASYFQAGGWPHGIVLGARALALILAFQWIVPLWRVEVRVASFAFCGLHVYLTYFPFFPFPWYLPGPALLAAVALGGMIAQLLDIAQRRVGADRKRVWARPLTVGVIVVSVLLLGTEGWLTWQMRREMALEQVYSATGTRRKAGEWLKAHAQHGDTVFMEPLGHIGYFSGLKTYDFPGLSSKEVVNAIKVVGTNWAFLIDYLTPDWVVLRPVEYARVHDAMNSLFGPGNAYELATEINNLAPIQQVDVYVRKYVEFDAHLLIFKRQLPKPRLAPKGPHPLESLGLTPVEINAQQLFRLPANAIVSVPVPTGAKRVMIMYSVPPDTYDDSAADDFVEIALLLVRVNGHEYDRLQTHRLHPRSNPEDRKVFVFDARLPRHDEGARLILTAKATAGTRMEISWGEPEFLP
jgi:hypothetical protein